MRRFFIAFLFSIMGSYAAYAGIENLSDGEFETNTDGGVTSSGGGDSVAAEFTKVARHVALILKTNPQLGISSDAFLETVNSTFVISKETTILKGDEVEAINYPDLRKIEVNRGRWREHKGELRNRYVLVTHEYLGIMRIDDTKYQLSSKLFSVPGPAKLQIKCSAFDDLNTKTKKPFFMYFTSYNKAFISMVKTEEGDLMPRPYGDTVTSIVMNQKTPYLLVTVFVGRTRSIQIPIFRDKTAPKFKAIVWDAHGFGRNSALRQVDCEQTTW